VGQEATVTTDAYPGRVFDGRIVRVAPLLKETSREARVEVEITNPEGLLKPGMFVRVQIEFDRHDNATVVPTNALAHREDREGVFLVDLMEKKAHFVPVTVGIVSGDEAEITAPPLAGMVVTLGQHLLTDGSAIIVSGTAGAPSPYPLPVGEGQGVRDAGAKAGPSAEASAGRASGR
jgi:RND family efflux transporter MFP subunit